MLAPLWGEIGCFLFLLGRDVFARFLFPINRFLSIEHVIALRLGSGHLTHAAKLPSGTRRLSIRRCSHLVQWMLLLSPVLLLLSPVLLLLSSVLLLLLSPVLRLPLLLPPLLLPLVRMLLQGQGPRQPTRIQCDLSPPSPPLLFYLPCHGRRSKLLCRGYTTCMMAAPFLPPQYAAAGRSKCAACS